MSNPPVVDPSVPVEPKDPDPTDPTPEPKGTVAYETHQKLLREKKKADQVAAEYKAKLDAFEREKLEAAGEHQKIAAAEREARLALEAKLKARDEEDLMRRKLIALGNEAGVDSKYLRFLDPDEVAVDPETGEIDKATLVKAAQKVRTEYPAFLKKSGGTPPPADAPNGTGVPSTITRSEWMKLSSKEMTKWKPNQIIG